ncbi:MAG: hypothetical protein OXU27_08870 [Candidatus Poribacteria bacterium]|nr:hypothetical protein [Candidatus Poribacteria bacterium]
MKQINSTARVMSQTAKASATRLLNIGSKVGCAVNETVVNTSDKVISQVGIVKGKLPNLNLKQIKRITPAIIVGNLNAATPCALKDLSTVAKSLANRAGRIPSHKLFDLIPTGVKLRGKNTIKFLDTHDVSHRVSIKNDPTKAGDINNIIFESASKNRARGSKNMTSSEFQRARFSNTITGIKYGFKTAVGTAAKGALFGALLELPITVVENTLYVKNNRKSVGDARIDVAKDIGISAGFAGVTAAGFTGLSLLGVTLGPAVIPLTIVGGAVYIWSAADRIWKALDGTTLDKINSEQYEAVADLITAREQEEIADMLFGISMDGTSAELTRMREIREKAKARSKVAQELARINSKSEEEEFSPQHPPPLLLMNSTP